MDTTSRVFFSAVMAGALAATTTAQRFATYDPASGGAAEFATSNCLPAPALPRARPLFTRAPATDPLLGAIAADNINGFLYSATGRHAHGIDQVAFSDIGTGMIMANFPLPIEFNEITGMVVDPRDTTGQTLIITDGEFEGPYHVTTGVFLEPLQPLPVAVGDSVTGLTFDPWTEQLILVDSKANLRTRPLTGGPWSAPIAPLVAVPALPAVPTGVAIRWTAASDPMVSFSNGVVMDTQTGFTQPFPPGGAGTVRHPRGMTFFARPALLGGGALTDKPMIRLTGSYRTESPDCVIEVSSTAPVVLAIDLAPSFVGVTGLPMIDGTLFVSPATSVTFFFGPGTHAVPIDLTGVPPTVGVNIQAASLDGGLFRLSDAMYIETWL